MRIADSATARAVYLAPDSGRYQLTRAMYFLAGELPMVREGAGEAYRRGLSAAQRAQDSAVIAELAIELGLWYWRTYDGLAHRRRIGLDAPLRELVERAESRRDLDHLVEVYSAQADPKSGEANYLRSSEFFLIALRARPDDARAWVYSYMSLLALEAWEELESAASVRLRGEPDDVWAWMTMGMALHRTGKAFEAARAFDRALTLFDRREHARLTRLTRLLRPDDSARVAALSDAEQANTESIFWMLADPLTLTAENEHWLEFLSRVTFAELMFTVEEFNQRGADSQRGEVFIRYGAPEEIIGSGPVFGKYSIWWRYRNGLEFLFELYGPTRMVIERSFAQQRKAYDKMPHSFVGVPITRSMDTIPIALTRFRGTGDSADVNIAADIPITALTSGVDLRAGMVQIGFTAFTGAATLLTRDTASLRVEFDDGRSPEPLRRAWRQRFSDVDMGYRVEAFQVESGNSARAFGAIPIGALSGFAISDLLIADSLHSATTAPLRWNDLAIAPNLGTIRHGRNLAVAWETYDLGADSTRSSEYSVEIGLVRTDGSRLGRAVARVLSGTLGRAEGRGRDDRVAVSFDRRVPARPVTLDYLTLDLGDLAPGRYRLTITVTDAVRNVSAESVRELVIVR
jgi:GWxTD domain-containing protein